MTLFRSSLKFLALMGTLAFGLAGLITVTDILLRIFSNTGVNGVVDYVQLFVVSGAFLGMPYTFFEQKHVRVELVLDLLRAKWRRRLWIVTILITLAVVCGLSWYSWKGMLGVVDRGDISMNIALPMWLYWLPMVLGLVLSCVALVVLLLKPLLRGSTNTNESLPQ
ncbi:TRAP transporter small permease [Primorskyibacter sp. 2E233]|uniref:TRAP transporter small permease n=1 Tax=Primorskyibacter sp. 2E233 TaxID=3413431 RepID=UPI003BF0696D